MRKELSFFTIITVIMLSASSSMASVVVSGTVIDFVSSAPICSVEVATSGCTVYTDASGNFSLTIPTTGIVKASVPAKKVFLSEKNSEIFDLAGRRIVNSHAHGLCLMRSDFGNAKAVNVSGDPRFLLRKGQEQNLLKSAHGQSAHTLIFTKSGYASDSLTVSGSVSGVVQPLQLASVKSKVNFVFVVEKAGVVTHSTHSVDYTPTTIIITNPFGNKDTVSVSGDTVRKSYSGLTKGDVYYISALAYSPNYIDPVGSMSQKSFTVPDSSSFGLLLTVVPMVEEINLKVPIKDLLADSVKMVWTITNTSAWGGHYSDSVDTGFTAGTLDTVALDGVMPASSLVAAIYDVSLTIHCSDGSYYKGSGLVTVSPSINTSLSIVLVKYSCPASAVTTFVIEAVGSVSVSVLWP
jgi:hypothetical protein